MALRPGALRPSGAPSGAEDGPRGGTLRCDSSQLSSAYGPRHVQYVGAFRGTVTEEMREAECRVSLLRDCVLLPSGALAG